jgi:hypothetical protein
MRERASCVGCGRLSPETETNYTLISSQFGWRLNRYRKPTGEFVVEWRCPACWKQFKDQRRDDGSGRPPAPSRPPAPARAPSPSRNPPPLGVPRKPSR